MKKRPVIILVVLIAIVIGLVVWWAQYPTVKNPEISVRFLGMTNEAAGEKMARFELRNIGKVTTEVSIPGFIDIGMRGGGYFGFTNALLRPGASLHTSIKPPMTRDQWRAEFLCSIPLNSMQKLRNLAAKYGVPVIPVAQDAISIYSERLDPMLETDKTSNSKAAEH